MATDDRVVRAQCRALLRTIADYQLEHIGNRGTGDLWNQLDSIGRNPENPVDLESGVAPIQPDRPRVDNCA